MYALVHKLTHLLQGPFPFVINLNTQDGHKIPLHTYIQPQDLAALASQHNASATGQPWKITLPVVVDFHGGGFFMGSCLEQAPFCAKLCRDLNAVAMTVDYRMGPVDKFPAANVDADEVILAIIDSSRSTHQQIRNSLKDRIIEDWKQAETKRLKIKHGRDNEPQIKVPPELANFDVEFDLNRIAISGFSSGSNLALNLAISVPANTDPNSDFAMQSATYPRLTKAWPSPFGPDWKAQIPLLLFYPSLDARQLPSERTRPPDMPIPSGFWAETNDILMPTYLPRFQTSHLRASPGLANTQTDLHSKARMFLVLPSIDNLAHQSEIWVKKVQQEGRGRHLRIERYKGMKHGW